MYIYVGLLLLAVGAGITINQLYWASKAPEETVTVGRIFQSLGEATAAAICLGAGYGLLVNLW